MSRMRIKDNSDFSVVIKYTDPFRGLAAKVIDFVKRTFTTAIVTTYIPEGEQRQTYTVIEIAKKRKRS